MNNYYERLKIVKEKNLVSSATLLQLASVFLLWGKITEEQYSEIIG